MSDTSVDAQLADRVRAVAPDLAAIEVLHRGAKGVVLSGTVAGEPVSVKLLTHRTPFWQRKFAAEIATYRAFAAAPPPVPTPRLLAAAPEAGVLVTSRLPGTPVAVDRYPSALTAAGAAPLLVAVQALSDWTMPAGLFSPVWDYSERLNRYRDEYRLLTGRDTGQLSALLAVAAPMRLAHGDLLPANVLQTGGRLSGVVDWEFTGLYLPHLDAALLWLLLGHLPRVRRFLEKLPGKAIAQQAAFWINVAVLCVRELHIHEELPAGPARNQRLLMLHETWTTVSRRVANLTGGR